MKYYPGTILKRVYEDYQQVEVIDSDDTHTKIKDSNGIQFVPNPMLDSHFVLVSVDDLISTTSEHQNLDDPKRHNIAGTMNLPSERQKEAFMKVEKK